MMYIFIQASREDKVKEIFSVFLVMNWNFCDKFGPIIVMFKFQLKLVSFMGNWWCLTFYGDKPEPKEKKRQERSVVSEGGRGG